MLELIKYIVLQFAERPDEVTFKEEIIDDKNTTITIVLSDSDMGKVIGRQGRIAKALRTIVRSASAKTGIKYNIEIKEIGEI